jgi:glycine amidinotransferase
MTGEPQRPLVNAWDEWGSLEEVVVGRADMACFEPTEPGSRPQRRDASGDAFPTGPKPAVSIARANEELDNLADVLASRGITVRRPAIHDFTTPVRAPTFTVQNQYCAVCPRDVLITIGNEIIEATMSRRARFFEYLPYRPLLYHYWNNDPSMVWTAAPKPTMADEMYQEDFWDRSMPERHARMHAFDFCITQDEVCFDAADMSRFGRDLIIQESMTTNRQGINWIRRHLEPKGLRVHTVHFPLDFFPSHIDCTMVPLRPGLVLTNPDRPLREGEERLFHANGWEMIAAPEPTTDNDQMPLYCQSSKWLSMNVLSLAPDVVVCEEQEKPLHDLLDDLGFEVVRVPFRNVFEFGGALHCATWDVRRASTIDDYFPNLEK